MANTLLAIALAVVGYLVVYLVLKKKIARALHLETILREVREEVDRLQVELNQTTNRNVTLIEDRLNALSEALGKADKKILLFRREAEKQELSGKLYTELSARRHLGETPAGAPAEAVPAAATPVPTPASTPASTPVPTPASEPADEESPPDRRAEAVRLARSGLSPALIARRLGLTMGEVELILSLAELER